jgi:FkbM family methyltransferase
MNIKQLIINLFIYLVPVKILKIIARNAFEKVYIDSYKFKVSYSQKGEDILLQNIFDKKSGFYVDVGAYHPVIYSNSYVFYLRGWRGINIEPNTDNFVAFNEIRGRDINLNIAVSPNERNLTYYKFNYGAVNTLNKEHAAHWAKQPGYVIEQQLDILVKPLRKILSENIPENTDIEFMSVDCEGMDLDVLKSNDWEVFRPKLVLVEFLYYDFENYRNAELYQYMISKDYEFYSIVGITMFFIDKNRKEL